jgi:RNA polymerase sigma factor (sigma-70 family)
MNSDYQHVTLFINIMETDNSQLIDRALRGNEKACAELVSRFKPRIFNFVLRMVKNREEAEDLTQETFIKAFNSLATFNSDYAFSTWLYKIAVNNCIDHFRKKRLKTYPIDNPITVKDGEIQREFPDQYAKEPEKSLISKEQSTLIECAIKELPPKYQQVITLRHTLERSYEEISAELKIPIGTVKVRIFRAREMLKKALKTNLRN